MIANTSTLSLTTYEVSGPIKIYKSFKSGYSPMGAIYELLNDGYFGLPSVEIVVRKYGIEVTRKELLEMAKAQKIDEGRIKYYENGRLYVEVTI